ncbi:hypothetical protein [Microbacterium sp. No. 7]|uniref:hypothetical protein n=1 Tax=Microbacterium sp. No. 7 TaxID=1714373 RepID=UPI0006D10AAD|nr:hypothetical protein [Microbacterium sp. No. 7]ALJ19510.1 hypothetical protein AOA12_06150 [Microbacterium sp. No. 7]
MSRALTHDRLADRTKKLLKAWGLDPANIFDDGWDDDGYDEVVRDSFGQPKLDPNTSEPTMLRRRREWPKGFPVDELRRLSTLMLWVALGKEIPDEP